MAFPTAVNDQIMDSITQVNVKVLCDGPTMSMANLLQSTSQALSNAAHNATSAQQQTTITAQEATAMGVATIYSVDAASAGIATNSILALSKTQEHDALFLGNLKLGKEDVEALQKMQHLKYMHLSNIDVAPEHLQALAASMPSTEIYREQTVKV